MQSSFERRIARLEAVLHERDREPLRIFARVINHPLQGFVAYPAGPQIDRLTDETPEALERRCAELAPAVMVWRST
ncbi:hypothetical protein [Melaminivora alkalimesophila]|uniref:Uncharacterized protein n=1 Tax=Melaminivora alkalimesophila TaxID=1165852 RepID=A0A317RDB6_9BURK|nr:hypothetical protein [Melaminivora alkalimesophila]PWW47740.1 hypothetical protein DFR36_102113 [Melaminivora alkalimesophila]